MYLTVYVDDSIIVGPSMKELEREQADILKAFKGTKIEPSFETDSDGVVWEVRDILGSTHKHCKSARRMRVSMETYIQKVLDTFNLQDIRQVQTPCVTGDLSVGREVDFPLKSLVGALQWVATICRPDIQFAVHRVQRCTVCTRAAVNAAKRICA